MIYFSLSKVIFSIFHALIYGILFGFICSVFKYIPPVLKNIIIIPKSLIVYSGPISSYRFIKNRDKKATAFGNLAVFFKIVLFSLGFILLSYYSLDGEARFYLVVFSLIGVKLSRILSVLLYALLLPIKRILYFLLIFLRIILYPLKIIVYFILKKYIIALSKLEKHIPKRKCRVRNEEK